MLPFLSKMHQKSLSAGAPLAGRAYSAPPDPLAVWGWDEDFSNSVPSVTKSWLRAWWAASLGVVIMGW